jgi:hypothetical protein
MKIYLDRRIIQFKTRTVLTMETTKWKFCLSGLFRDEHEKRICFVTVFEKDRCKSYSVRGINPLPRWKYQISWRLEYFWKKISGKKPIMCQGCGEGVAKYSIAEPNGENYLIKVCNACVNFYDWRFSRKEL